MGAAGLALGAIAGAVVWVVGMVVTSGVCSIPVLDVLWCTFAPGPGGSIGDSLSVLDVLSAPIAVGIGSYLGFRMATGRTE